MTAVDLMNNHDHNNVNVDSLVNNISTDFNVSTVSPEDNMSAVVVVAASLPPEVYHTEVMTATTTSAPTAYGEPSSGDGDYRLTLFIAASSMIILTLISIIGFVSCFILCNENNDHARNRKSLITSMSSNSALNLLSGLNLDAYVGDKPGGLQTRLLKNNLFDDEDSETDDSEDEEEKEDEEDPDDTGDYGGPGMQGYRVTIEDYFPSPTQILHEIQPLLLAQAASAAEAANNLTTTLSSIGQSESNFIHPAQHQQTNQIPQKMVATGIPGQHCYSAPAVASAPPMQPIQPILMKPAPPGPPPLSLQKAALVNNKPSAPTPPPSCVTPSVNSAQSANNSASATPALPAKAPLAAAESTPSSSSVGTPKQPPPRPPRQRPPGTLHKMDSTVSDKSVHAQSTASSTGGGQVSQHGRHICSHCLERQLHKNSVQLRSVGCGTDSLRSHKKRSRPS